MVDSGRQRSVAPAGTIASRSLLDNSVCEHLATRNDPELDGGDGSSDGEDSGWISDVMVRSVVATRNPASLG